jgi:hypothetical protein
MGFFPRFSPEAAFEGVGDSPAAQAAKGAMCESLTCQSAVGGAIGAATSIGNLFNHISDSKDFCLNPGQTAGNTMFQLGKNFLNLFGGLGDLTMGQAHNPLGDMQKKLSRLNQQYEQSFKQYTQAFASAQASFDEEILKTLPIMNSASSKNTQFYYEVISEKEELDRIYILFLFIYIIIVIIYIMIHK